MESIQVEGAKGMQTASISHRPTSVLAFGYSEQQAPRAFNERSGRETWPVSRCACRSQKRDRLLLLFEPISQPTSLARLGLVAFV